MAAMFVNFRRMLAAAATLALVACGGGGGSAGTPPFGGGDGGGGGVQPARLELRLSTTTVTAAAPATITAKVSDAAGVALPGVVVTFESVSNLGNPTPASALTDATGTATSMLQPATGALSGADLLRAKVTINGVDLQTDTGFQLTATNVAIANFVSDISTLAAYGDTTLTVTLSGFTAGTPVKISLSSGCVNKSRATLTPSSATTSTGSATFTYRDQGCGAFDLFDGVQAAVEGTTATANLQLSLTSPVATSIAFVSADPPSIFLRGSGFVENSNVIFQVRDANGAGVPNQSVTLEATTLAGGLTIDGGGVPVTKVSDPSGNVLVRINSGSVPTPVRIKATLNGNGGISTVSSNLAIAVGLPSQLNFSLSQATINIEGYDYDGTTNTYTVIASDRLGNPVPADTAINFISEGSQIQAIRFTRDANGLSNAVANFFSSEPRPLDGRLTILSYALGEKSFLDVNGNNLYDPAEEYQDIGDVFLDRLLNRSYNTTNDQFISLSISGNSACTVAASPLLGLPRSIPSRTITQSGAPIASCTAGWGRAYVRRQVETVLSRSTSRPTYGTQLPLGSYAPSSVGCPVPITLGTGDYAIDDTSGTTNQYVFGTVEFYNVAKGGAFSLSIADSNSVAFNPMPAGTLLTVAPSDGMSAEIFGSPVPSTSTPSGATVRYQFSDGIFSGTVTVIMRTPKGVATAWSQFLSMNAPPGDRVACP